MQATLWEGGCRANGFIHSPLLSKIGFTYHGLVHVSGEWSTSLARSLYEVAPLPALLTLRAPRCGLCPDWFPTMVSLAGGHPADHPGLDGHNVWEAITSNSPSPRTELLHNIDIFGGLGSTGFGNANIRVGDLKLIVGDPGSFEFDPEAGRSLDGYFIPPGCSPQQCPTPQPPAHLVGSCAPDTPETHIWLFNITGEDSSP
jgi:hypothetical protein